MKTVARNAMSVDRVKGQHNALRDILGHLRWGSPLA